MLQQRHAQGQWEPKGRYLAQTAGFSEGLLEEMMAEPTSEQHVVVQGWVSHLGSALFSFSVKTVIIFKVVLNFKTFQGCCKAHMCAKVKIL